MNDEKIIMNRIPRSELLKKKIDLESFRSNIANNSHSPYSTIDFEGLSEKNINDIVKKTKIDDLENIVKNNHISVRREDVDELLIERTSAHRNVAFDKPRAQKELILKLEEFASKNSGRICNIFVSKNGTEKRKGTGYFLTDTCVLTCYHVVCGKANSSDDLNDVSIHVEVPFCRGNTSDSDFGGSFMVRYEALEVQNKPCVLAESPTLPNDEEKAAWSSNDSNRECFDYCIIEINTKVSFWNVNIRGSLTSILDKSTFNLFYQLDPVIPVVYPDGSNEGRSIVFPNNYYEAEDLSQLSSATVYSLSEDLEIKSKTVGDVIANKALKRIRYRGIGIQYGDSGCPVVDGNTGQLIAIHNAESNDKMLQAIPIGYIMRDAKNKGFSIKQ